MNAIRGCFNATNKRARIASKTAPGSSKQDIGHLFSIHRGHLRASSYSSLTPNPHSVETIDIGYGSNQVTSLTIFHPISGSWFESAILYLPAGPILEQSSRPSFDDAIISALSATSNSTIVRVNYRTGKFAPFPLPLHDVLAGYDWLKEFLKEEDEVNSETRLRRIGVCGQLFGGGLATSLALTECRPGPQQVIAAAVNNPIIDWVVPDRLKLEIDSANSDSESQIEVGDRESDFAIDVAKSRKRNKSKGPDISSWQAFMDSEVLPADTLFKARNHIFTNQNGYFDAFASPIHLFRTTGIEVNEDLRRGIPVDEEPSTPGLLRKYRVNFPPSGSDLKLPHIRLTTGDESILSTQNMEFNTRINTAEVTNYLRPRNIKHAKYKQLMVDDKDEVDFICDVADRKFPLNTLPGVGLWGIGKESIWRPDVEDAGRWLRSLMLPP